MQALTTEQGIALGLNGNTNCLIAGPGAGKTHLMVERIIQDAGSGGHAPSMVVVTFTTAAAKELRERLERRAFRADTLGHIGTLHSFAARELRKHWPDRKLATEKDIKAIIDDTKRKLGAMARSMSNPEVWRHTLNPPKFGNAATIGMAVRNQLRRLNLTHHDMVLVELLDLIKAGKVLAPEAVYVDEYQDSGPTDEAIYGEFEKRGASLYLIGDPRQAIYGFRGAQPENLARAWRTAGARAQLTMCHRSSPEICELATWIARAIVREDFNPAVVAVTDKPGTVERYEYSSQEEEMVAAAKWARYLSDSGRSVAILTRYNSQAQAMAGVLRAEAPGRTITCSADPQLEGQQTLQQSIELLQQNASTPDWFAEDAPHAWWRKTMTHLGIPFAHQDILIDRLAPIREVSDLISLGEESDPYAGKLHVATIHGAKGLEWDAVLLLGADAEAFPRKDAEAGRLVFVACTRARRHLVTSHAASRPIPMTPKRHTDLKQTPWLP